jgi:LuxR family maltose regulon positive regulatory protein
MEDGTYSGAERRRLIERPRLLRLLDETDARIILLVAPAGYGKTTLARQWLAMRPRSAWFRATAASADPASFASAFTRAATQIVAEAGTVLRQRLQASDVHAPTVQEIADLVADDLQSWPTDAWLGIDDQHSIAGSPAEDVLDGVIDRVPVRLVVTTRSRPRWATARRFMYGEVVELGRDDLTFTPQEALGVLVNRPRSEAEGIHTATRGWPAVIGLASLTTESPPSRQNLPDALHQYFAEELFHGLDDDVRAEVLALAVAPSITTALVESLFPGRAEQVIGAAVGAGFANRVSDAEFEVHPLLRAFLLAKLADEPQPRREYAISAVTDFFLEARSWDDVFATARAFSRTDVLVSLLERALNDCLTSGRLATIERWADEITAQGIDAPVVALARAELDFRHARYRRSEIHALRAADSLEAGNRLLSQAWFRAGQAAHFQDNASLARSHYGRALAAATSVVERRHALWGSFNLAAETESATASSYLTRFEAAGAMDAEAKLRSLCGRVGLAVRRGDVHAPIEAALANLDLLSQVADPLARSGFLNALTHCLNIAGRYEEAHDLARREIADAKAHRVSFALPHAVLQIAVAQIGMRRLRDARREMRSLRPLPTDVHIAMNLAIVLARLHVADGRLDLALARVGRDWPNPASRGVEGELLAMRALVLAAGGSARESDELVQHVFALTGVLEAVALAEWSVAINSLGTPRRNAAVRDAFDSLTSSGNADSFVTAYRARPELLSVLCDHGEPTRQRLREILLASHDFELARAHGISDDYPDAHGELSPREAQVLELLSEGQSNREIAKTLFISESTVKVHVRRVLQKLGVRTRTQAALKRREWTR